MRRRALKGKIKQNTGGGGDFLNLKEVGSAVIHIHGNRDVDADGDAELEERYTWWLPADKDGGKSNGGYKRKFVGRMDDDNPFQDLLLALEASTEDELAGDVVVLFADNTTYTKDEILGRGNGHWQKDLRPGYELLYAVVVSGESGERLSKDETRLVVLGCKPSLAEAIDGVIDVQVRENGEEEGEAAVAGYGIEIVYDEDATPAKKYTARYNGRPAKGHIGKLHSGPGIDLDKFCGPPDAEQILEIVQDALVVEVPGLDIEPMGVYETKNTSPKKRPGARKKARRRKPAPPPEPVEEEVEEEEEAAPKPARRRNKVKAKKPAPPPEPVEEEEEEVEEEEEEEEEEETPPPKKRGRRKKAAPPPDDEDEDAGAQSGGSKIQCPSCGEETLVSATQKSCTHCNHVIIPW